MAKVTITLDVNDVPTEVLRRHVRMNQPDRDALAQLLGLDAVRGTVADAFARVEMPER